jgi:hypothetical protein
MRTVTRVIAATALGVPMLLAGPMAMAGGDGDGHRPPKPKPSVSQSNETEQDNANAQPITQTHVGGKGDQSALAQNDQSNDNSTEQSVGEED